MEQSFPVVLSVQAFVAEISQVIVDADVSDTV